MNTNTIDFRINITPSISIGRGRAVSKIDAYKFDERDTIYWKWNDISLSKDVQL
jgi:hypothetical protein